ncbi:murein hydrolase activator EnvC family protein, partial [Blastococcus capsensis]|uniref:murein hydrolase activator EnvC family protein n=1 Tax=Blastococcus capsensis TaxID=1564163 RepID=UPI002541EBB4
MRSGLAVVLALVIVAVLAPVGATAGPAPPVPPSSGVAAWVAPLPGRPVVGRPFEPPPHRYGPGHRGVDLVGAPGAPVLAAGDGVVAFAGMVAGRPVVSIDHADGLRTTYEPVERSVGAGARVTPGSPIGTLAAGHDGCPATGCLHWGLRRGEDYLDPLALLRPPRIRLLPMGRVGPAGGLSRSSSGRSRRPLDDRQPSHPAGRAATG